MYIHINKAEVNVNSVTCVANGFGKSGVVDAKRC